MSTPYYTLPQPFLHRFAVAGQRLRVGAAAQYRRNPDDRRQWLIYYPLDPGANTHGLFIAAKRDEEYVEAGDEVLVVQYFGEVLTKAVLRKGEKVFGGQYERGMRYGTPLTSSGDASGSLMAASRFISAARVAATAVEDCDLTDADEDGLILVRTCIYRGEVAEAG